MRGPIFLVALTACLSGCGRESSDAGPAGHHGGRYVGIGVYPVTDLWEHMIAARRPGDPAAATTEDDSQVIVVVDSNTGEIRQCGNLSGHCIGMNPWASPLGQGQAAPVRLDMHEVDLAHVAAASANAAEAASDAAARHR